jgi:hypothetical protein
MADITLEELHGYLDEALSAEDTARVEQALRQSAALQQQLRAILHERDRGEHTVGAIWRRERLSCPSREELGSYLLGVLEPDHQDYVRFHVETIRCPFCQANLTDMQNRRREPPAQAQQRRKKLFESSAGLISAAKRR